MPSWVQLTASKNSSSVPKPPGSMTNASAASAIAALRSCMVSTTMRLVSASCASSFACRARVMTPKTSPRSASSRPRAPAACAYAGSAPWLEPQYTATADSWPGGWLLIRERQPLLGLRVEVVRQRAALGDGDVAFEVIEVGRPDDGARQAGVAEREAEHELHPRQAAGRQQLLQAG